MIQSSNFAGFILQLHGFVTAKDGARQMFFKLQRVKWHYFSPYSTERKIELFKIKRLVIKSLPLRNPEGGNISQDIQ